MTIVVCVVRGFVQTCFLTTSDTAVQDSRVDRQKRQELIYRQFTVAKQCAGLRAWAIQVHEDIQA